MPIGDITNANGTWHQIFADDFATTVPVGSFPGTVYSAKWYVYPNGWKDTSKNGVNWASKVDSVVNAPSCHAGCLNMYLHTELINGVYVHLASGAPQPILPGHSAYQGQSYGRYTVRFHIDPVPGYKEAWLLWPDSGIWPGDGEIDFPEGNLNSTINAFMHHANPAGGQDAFSTSVPEAGAWHIATTEWGPGKVTFILDGVVIGTSTTQVPTGPMWWAFLTETAMDGTIPSNTAAGNVEIDWVTAYSRS